MSTESKSGGPLYQFFQKHGWCQGTYHQEDGLGNESYCLMGAAYSLGFTPAQWHNLYSKAYEYADKHQTCRPDVAALNDIPDMTKDRIMEFLLENDL